MAAINTTLIYVLKNSFTAAAKILAQSGSDGSLFMVNANNVLCESLWFLIPAPAAHPQHYRLHTVSNAGPQYPYRLSNNFTGPDKYLDVDPKTFEADLSTGLHTGQYWSLIPTDTVVVNTS
ncbi:carbohydrate-binding module family 13 protein [Trichoderma evansii]